MLGLLTHISGSSQGPSMTTFGHWRWLIGHVRMTGMVNQRGIQDHGKKANRIGSL